MVAYLALHRHEPVTGERLRTRVLAHADVDASQRTLANTASAVRRSLGVDAEGPRLHPVTSSGLYATHGVSSDVEVVLHARGAGPSTPRRATPSPLCPRSAAAHQGRAARERAARFRMVSRRRSRARDSRATASGRRWRCTTRSRQGNYELAFWAHPAGTPHRPLQRRAQRGADAGAAATRVWRRWSRPIAAPARQPPRRCSDELVVLGPQPAGLSVAPRTAAAGRRRGTWRANRESC